jgi:hypothetical protein
MWCWSEFSILTRLQITDIRRESAKLPRSPNPIFIQGVGSIRTARVQVKTPNVLDRKLRARQQQKTQQALPAAIDPNARGPHAQTSQVPLGFKLLAKPKFGPHLSTGEYVSIEI